MKNKILLIVVWLSITAQVLPPHLQPGDNIGEIGPDEIERPMLPGLVNKPPPLLCTNGESPSCNPVNDVLCDSELACAGEITVGKEQVYAPALLSPLGIEQKWREHWQACQLHNFQLQDLVNQLSTMLVIIPPTCSNFSDGPGGKLWKPVSDNTGRPVFLLPGSFQTNRGGKVGEVFSVNSEKIADVSYRSIANGGREHYDINVLASSLDKFKPITININRGAGVECFVVEEPTKRVD